MKPLQRYIAASAAALLFLTLMPIQFAYAQSSLSLVEGGTEPVRLAEGFKFSEGPAVDKSGNIWFSDYGTDTLYVMKRDGSPEKVLEKIGGPIGLYFDYEGLLYICAARDHCIKKMAPDKTITAYPDKFDGKLFNSPNDIWIDRKGGVYFTDPRFAPLPEEVEQDGYHVYYILPHSTTIIRAADNLNKPNGIVGSPDGKLVYVTDTPEDKTFVYDVGEDGRLAGKRLFAEEGYDGMTVDSEGNVYITMEHSIEIYSPDGVKIESIPAPDKPTNVCFGGNDRKTLYVTGRSSLYSFRMRVGGL